MTSQQTPVSRRTDERTSPLHDAHVAAGASFTDFAGWQMPVRYSSDLAEHHAVRTAAGLFDLSHMAEIVLIGPEAGAVARLRPRRQALRARTSTRPSTACCSSRTGGIIDDLVVYRTGEDRYMVVANASNRDAVAEELRDRTAPFDVEVFDESDDIALIAVQGPAALAILARDAGARGGRRRARRRGLRASASPTSSTTGRSRATFETHPC